ncbi:MAG: hypothetical protein LBP60_00145 [Spirochaetaceae bacterium]|jgi:hypothetical protein|nr:hypothetical protein [Spirochaetaceae bacterium]
MKKLLLVCTILCAVSFSAGAAEYTDGRIRLVINENTGRFSLYFMTDIARERYFPFFVDQDPRTSFLALMVNNRNYRMGESASFKTRLGGTPSNPVLIFESSFLTVTEEFSFVRTGSSSLTNGIRLTISITNRGERPVEAGARFLIDTTLGEEGSSHFITDRRQIHSEAVIDASSGDSYWISKNSQLALMGSVDAHNLTRPDFIHLANWKRLNDTPWKTPFISGRNFNFLPYSINDSAVCYYYEPAVINPKASRIISIVLASEDENGFALNNSVPDDLSQLIQSSAKFEGADLREAIQTDLITLRDMVNRLDMYLSSGTSVPEDELAAIGLLISKIKSKYGIP